MDGAVSGGDARGCLTDRRASRWLASRRAARSAIRLDLLVGPADLVRGAGYPPVERVTFQRVVLEPDGIVATVLNDGPDAVTIAQVQSMTPSGPSPRDSGLALGHLGRTTLRIPYPWVEGEAHVVRVLTSTGTTFEHEIAVAVVTPTASVQYFAVFTLIGVYVGVLPVAIGDALVSGPGRALLSRDGLSAGAHGGPCWRSCWSTAPTRDSRRRPCCRSRSRGWCSLGSRRQVRSWRSKGSAPG